jgi:hypothetical protein
MNNKRNVDNQWRREGVEMLAMAMCMIQWTGKPEVRSPKGQKRSRRVSRNVLHNPVIPGNRKNKRSGWKRGYCSVELESVSKATQIIEDTGVNAVSKGNVSPKPRNVTNANVEKDRNSCKRV